MKQRYFDARTGLEVRHDGEDPMKDKKVSGKEHPWRSKTLHQKSASEVTQQGTEKSSGMQSASPGAGAKLPDRQTTPHVNDRNIYAPMEELHYDAAQKPSKPKAQMPPMPPIPVGGVGQPGGAPITQNQQMAGGPTTQNAQVAEQNIMPSNKGGATPMPPAPAVSPGSGGGTEKPPNPGGGGPSAGAQMKNPPPVPMPPVQQPPTMGNNNVQAGPLPSAQGGQLFDAHRPAKVRVQHPQSTKRIETFGGKDKPQASSFEQAEPHPTGDEFPTPRPAGAGRTAGMGKMKHFDMGRPVEGADESDTEYDAIAPSAGSMDAYQHQNARYDARKADPKKR